MSRRRSVGGGRAWLTATLLFSAFLPITHALADPGEGRDYVTIGPLLSGSAHRNEQVTLGVGIEAAYLHAFAFRLPLAFLAPLGAGGFVQVQGMDGISKARGALGVRAMVGPLGLDVGAAQETGDSTHATTTLLQIAPFIGGIGGRLSFRFGLPLRGAPGYAREMGVTVVFGLPIGGGARTSRYA